MKFWSIRLLALIVLLAAQANSATIRVPQDQSTIQGGVVAAAPNDTVLVAPGNYAETIQISGKAVCLRSESGPQGTILVGTVTISNVSAGNSEFSGFTMGNEVGTGWIIIDYADAIISDNIFTGITASATIVSCRGKAVTIFRNLFNNNAVGNACVGVVSGQVRIINNTFDSNSRGFFSLDIATIALNNIVTNSTEYGVFGNYQTLAYNDVWQNAPNYDAISNSPADISVDPMFGNPQLGDYSLLPGSPCIDAGDPRPEFSDPDGTRNDIGAIPRAANFPVAAWLLVGSKTNERVPESIPQITWRYLDDAGGTQVAFEIEVGTDRDWSVAEMWNSGEVVSADTFVTYAGLPLVDGESYWLRVRLQNEMYWGNWSECRFRMNRQPGQPTVIAPTSGELLSPTGVTLRIFTGSDGDGDSLDYLIEVYADESFSELVATVGKIEIIEDTVYSEMVPGLLGNQTYWWRASVTDGYEFSEWVNAPFFLTKSLQTIHVPAEQPTIQDAIIAATDGDSVLVAPGTYFEQVSLRDRDVKVIATGGAEVTRLARPAGTPTSYASVIFLVGVTRETEFSGFTLRDEYASDFVVTGQGARPVIRDNIFSGLSGPRSVIFTIGGNALVTKNIFHDNNTNEYCVKTQGACDIIGNTFDYNYRGVYSNNYQVNLINNIISNSRLEGAVGQYRSKSYNNIWNNHPDYAGTTPSVNDISLDPQYVDRWGADFRLRPGSPCRDSGNPDPEYNDPDGSRNDIGRFAYRDIFPVPVEIAVDIWDNRHVVDSLPIIRWQFLNDNALTQSKYDIEVGTDDDWSATESWNSGEVDSDTGLAIYSGIPLQRGVDYYLRQRVEDGGTWGVWREITFRRNSLPHASNLLAPINGDSVYWETAKLVIAKATDPDDNAFHYDYEVYADDSLTQLEYSAGNQSDTMLSLSGHVLPARSYWWRVRSNDGREYSSWSQVEKFIARPGKVIEVPEQYPTIQLAMAAAHDGDTILVAPGSYHGVIDFLGKKLALISSGGADQTFLTSPNGTILTQFFALPNNGRAEISGFTVDQHVGTNVIRVWDKANPLIQNMKFSANNCEVVIRVTGGSALIKNNLFATNITASACVGVNSGTVAVVNNTFHRNSRGMYSFSALTVARNNIITESTGYGVYGTYAFLNFNDVWSNQTNYQSSSGPGSGSISLMPMFRNIVTGDFRLLESSPCIDTGDPDTLYNDFDGSRSDMGAFTSALHYPAAFSLIRPSSGLYPVQTTITPEFEWSATQGISTFLPIIYSLSIAGDSSFSFVLNIDDLDTNALEIQTPLEWGKRYWWKVRATVADEGEIWSNEVFTFRTMTLGDVDGSGRLNITDIVFLINYLFAGGPNPDPILAGDADCSGRINIGDAVYLVNYIFGDGPLPCAEFSTNAPDVDFKVKSDLREDGNHSQ